MKQFLEQTIREAGAIGKQYFFSTLDVSEKTSGSESQYPDIVTNADIAVNKFLVDTISQAYPTHTLTSEELDAVQGTSEYEWVIDPIDGTWNFAHGIPTWGIIISIQKQGNPYLSAVYFPISDQLFFADEEHAYLNGKQIHITSTNTIDQAKAKLFTMRPFGPYGVNFDRFQKAVNTYLHERECMPKNFGAASSHVYLTTGVFDFAISNGGADWDFLAPVHIIRMAGGIVTDSHGNPWQRGSQEYIAAANAQLHEQVLALFE